MNNKIMMSVIAVMITILLAVLLIWGASSCDARSNPVYIEGGEYSEPEQSESSEENSSANGAEDSIFDDLEEGELIGDFEGSDKPTQSSSGGNAPASSSSGSSEQSSGSSANSSRPSGNTSSRPSSGSTSSRPSSGSSSSTSSGSSSSTSSGSSSSSSSGSSEKPSEMTYEEYMAMSGSEQEKYMKSFESIDAFFNWYNAAKNKYETENPSIEIGDGPIDMNEIINGENG